MWARLREEDNNKSIRIKKFMGDTTHVTCFFSKKSYYTGTTSHGGTNKPTLFIPFGKRLGTQDDGNLNVTFNNTEYPKATLAGALMSIPSQFVYDICLATTYIVLFVPSLLLAVGYGIHASLYNDSRSASVAQNMTGNLICAPYFVLAIAVDLVRELIALVTRSYATFTESPEGKAQDYWVADHCQFASAT